MRVIAATPDPPYWAVIFTSRRTRGDEVGYAAMAALMEELAAARPGYLGLESAREGLGLTVSYWRDLEAIDAWRADMRHVAAQRLGVERWYAEYQVRIARVERAYGSARELG